MKPDASMADDSLATRESLLEALKSWDNQLEWQRFFDRYWRFIFNIARRAGLSATEAEDVVQETILTLAKKMPNFEYKPDVCSFKGWVMHVCRLRIIDQFRKRGRFYDAAASAHGDQMDSGIETVPSFESLPGNEVWEDEWEKNLLQSAIESVRAQVSPKHFQMFDLYVLREMDTSKISEILNVNAAQIYLAKHRLTKMVRHEYERLLKSL